MGDGGLTTAADFALEVAERVIQLLQHGSKTSTYKQAVLVALMDLCMERTEAAGVPPSSVTTRQLAEKVIELYWPQARSWGPEAAGASGVLLQNNKGQATILRDIIGFRASCAGGGAGAVPLAVARFRDMDGYLDLVRNVEWTLIRYPLPKLQNVAGTPTDSLYAIDWTEAGAGAVRRSEVTAYQSGHAGAFDNLIRFKPGVAEAFTRLHGILRPFVLESWASKVAALNRLEAERLPAFLFGRDRLSLEPVRRPLVALQRGRCFYCAGALARAVDVDHFIPWSRHPDDSVGNLVAAHPKCNSSKRDHLAGIEHVRRWRQRTIRRRAELLAVGEAVGWRTAENSLGVARAIYLNLPADARLWTSGKEFELADRATLLDLLGA